MGKGVVPCISRGPPLYQSLVFPPLRHQLPCVLGGDVTKVFPHLPIYLYISKVVFSLVSGFPQLLTLFTCQCASVSGNLGVYAANLPLLSYVVF